MFTLKKLFENNYQSDSDIINMYLKNGHYDKNNFTSLNNNKQINFKLLDGPPFISGSNINKSNLHLGHCLISYLKSAFDIYYLMNEYNVDLTTSSDNHGLPTELLISNHLNLNGTSDIKAYGLDKFNSTGLKLIDTFEKAWYEVYKKLGRDYSTNHYRTSQLEYMAVIWNTFSKLHKNGYIYKGVKILPYSYKLQTPLSNFEANENYKEIKTKTYYVKVKVENKIFKNSENLQYYFIFWTTTLWTIPFNIALCLNPDAKYFSIIIDNEAYIVEENYVEKFKKIFNKSKDKKIISEFVGYGKSLVNIDYLSVIPTFDKFKNKKIYKTYTDDYVDNKNKNGCGIVHLSPAFGEDDFRICFKNEIVDNKNIFNYCLIDDKGNFKSFYPLRNLKNLNIHSQEAEIIIEDYIKDSVILTETIKHNYPFSPRTNEPLIYKVCESYFVKVKENREKLIEQNEKINWKPSHIKDGRFGNWLKNAEDWCISRNRFFGTPLNIWVNKKDDSDILVIDSIQELEYFAQKKFSNIHPEFIYDLIIKKDNKEYENVKLTFDCWFESGCSCLIEFKTDLDFHQLHPIYPFELQNKFKPYDLCIEGIDQCRGYFYTSLIISTLLFNKPPFLNCICTGLIMDEKGKKLSKSSGNYQPPENYINEFGSDTLRLYLLGSVLGNGENLKFNVNDLKIYKQKIIQLLNSLKFLNDYTLKYYNTDIKFINIEKPKEHDLLDLWILSQLDELIIEVNNNFLNYEVKGSVKSIMEFIEKLTNYYLKFKRNEIKNNTERVFNILFFVYHQLILLLVPFCPMLCEYLYNLNITNLDLQKSIKYLTYPKPLGFFDSELNDDLNDFIFLLQNLRNIRKSNNEYKNKFINKIIIKSSSDLGHIKQLKEILKEDLKVLNVKFEYAKPIDYSLKFNFKEIGKNHKEIAKIIKNYNFNLKDKEDYYEGNKNYIYFNGIQLTDNYIESITPIYEIKDNNTFSINNFCVSFDYTETEKVKERNIIQSLIDDIQSKRKEQGINVYDSINIIVQDKQEKINIYKKYKYYMKKYLIVNDIIFLDLTENYGIKIEKL